MPNKYALCICMCISIYISTGRHTCIHIHELIFLKIINSRLRLHASKRKKQISRKAGLWNKFYTLPSRIHEVSKWEKEILPLAATSHQIYKGLLGVSRAGFAGKCCYWRTSSDPCLPAGRQHQRRMLESWSGER